MNNFQISDHFTFFEMTRTTHREYLETNRRVAYEDLSLLAACNTLCRSLLEPIREHFKSPLIIHSGFRCEALNKAIGGSQYSQHRHFQAADFHVVGTPLESVFDWIWQSSDLKFGQLILEGWAVGNPTWIHISLGPPHRIPERSQQVLTMEAGKYKRLA